MKIFFLIANKIAVLTVVFVTILLLVVSYVSSSFIRFQPPVWTLNKLNARANQLQEESVCLQRISALRTPDDTVFKEKLDEENNQALELLLQLAKSDEGWAFVTFRDGVRVLKRFLRAGPFVSAKDSQRGEKHVCVKSFGYLDATPEAVFRMFVDKSYVRSYNEHIVSMEDRAEFLPTPSSSSSITTQQQADRDRDGLKYYWSKLTWSSTPSYGLLFKARDFFSVVHFRALNDGSYIVVNRPAYHSSDTATGKKREGKFVRATILLAGNIIRPVPGHHNKTHLTMIAHVNPGGGVDTKAGAYFANKLCAAAPPAFIRKLERAAQQASIHLESLPKLTQRVQ